LSLPHRPHDEEEPLLARREILENGRQVELGYRADRARDEAQRHRRVAAVDIAVAAEARDLAVRIGKVDFLRVFEALEELGRKQHGHEPFKVFFGERRLAQKRREHARDAHDGLRADRKVQIGRSLGNQGAYHRFESLFVIHNYALISVASGFGAAWPSASEPSSASACGAGTAGAASASSPKSNWPPSVFTSSN